MLELPSYDELPVHETLGGRHSWHVFGTDDELGCVNLLTPEAVKAASTEIREGLVFNLCLPLNQPGSSLGHRATYRHHIFSHRRNRQDDVLDNFYLQGSTHWDALRHIAAREFGFYNQVTPEEAGPSGDKLGIDRWAEHGLVGRGLLVDVASYLDACGQSRRLGEEFIIDVQLLKEVLASEDVSLRSGDVLLLRTGFLASYLSASDMARTEFERHPGCPGLAAGEDMARFLWDSRVAAVAADNMAVESYPGSSAAGFLHRRLIPMLGLALGEWFNLEGLSTACSRDRRYTCFFVSVPLNLPRGVGSPANAIAIR